MKPWDRPKGERRRITLISGFGGGKKPGGGGVPVLSYFNVPDAGSYTGAPAIEVSNLFFDDSPGGMNGPRTTPGYGGPTNQISMSFWVRFNKLLVGNQETILFQITRHDSTNPYAGVSVKWNTSGAGWMNIGWALYSPWLNPSGYACPASNFPTMLETSGQVKLDKWHYVHVEVGNTARIMVLSEDDTAKGTWVAGTGNRIADSDTAFAWRGVIGHYAPTSTATLGITIPRMDFCNMRVGYQQTYSDAWWSANYWKKQINVDAERATMVSGGYSSVGAERALCYGYPFQADYVDQGARGPTFIPYSGSIISGTGPILEG